MPTGFPIGRLSPRASQPRFEIVAGLLIAFGIFTRWASLALFVFTAINIYYFHNLWNLQGAERSDQLVPALSELSIMGALLILAAFRGLHSSGVSDNGA